MTQIEVRNLEKYHGSNHVLQDVSFKISKGDRVAFVGKNGSGKSTIFNILVGLIKKDSGEIFTSKHNVFGLVQQMPEFTYTTTVRDIINSSFEKVYSLKEKMTKTEEYMTTSAPSDDILSQYGQMQETFEKLGGYNLENRISMVCKGLEISKEDMGKLFNELSGGEKTRIVLGKAILQEPDILLLDEPTNHLDVSSIEWLESFLNDYLGTVLIISHDRYFLDKVATKVIEIEDGRTHSFKGNYSNYQNEKAEILKNSAHEYELCRQKIRKMEATVNMLHAWGNKANERSLHQAAWKLEAKVLDLKKESKPTNEKIMNSKFSLSAFSSNDVVIVKDAQKIYGNKKILSNASFTIKRGQRVAIVGNNGSGKSTILKVLTGETIVDDGLAKLGESIKAGYLPQDISFDNPNSSILETLKDGLKICEEKVKPILIKFNFPKEDWHKAVCNISGGEQIRLKICLLMHQDINLLLLDEPTNHLDIYARDWLEKALEHFEGTMVFVTHDRYFANKFATRVLELEKGNVHDYAGDYAYYKDIKMRTVNKGNTPIVFKKTSNQCKELKTELAIKDNKKSFSKKHRSFEDESMAVDKENRAQGLENKIFHIEIEIKDIELQMSQHQDLIKLNQLYELKLKLTNQLEPLYEEWFETYEEVN